MKKCFVVSPIGDIGSQIRKHADNVLKGLIRPVCNSFEYEVVRIDELAGSKSIPSEIFSHLDDDDLVIADITGLNPNVLLELGYRMKTAKPYVIIRDKDDTDSTPFDIASIRYHSYGLMPDDLSDAIAVLSKAVAASENDYHSNVTYLGQDMYLKTEPNGSVSITKKP